MVDPSTKKTKRLSHARPPLAQVTNGVEIFAAILHNCSAECVPALPIFDYSDTCDAAGSVGRVRT
jgi:hypothetical protein